MTSSLSRISASVVALLLVSTASIGSAQYFEQARPGYLPTTGNTSSLSRAGSESGFQTYGPPPVRFGFAFDFGMSAMNNRKLDREFFAANGAPTMGSFPALAWDLTGYAQFMDSFRIGLNVGAADGGPSGTKANLLHAGLNLEGGRRFYTGWGLWLGANVGYGRSIASSYNNRSDSYFDYESRGLGIRGFARIEREVAPFITLRLTPFVDSLVRTHDRYTENVPMNAPSTQFPDSTRGTFVGYGVMLGVAIHSF